tara:strand:- start:744 stop:953 length:210 start_codon:yes stop_codon:yes gene_type:complete
MPAKMPGKIAIRCVQSDKTLSGPYRCGIANANGALQASYYPKRIDCRFATRMGSSIPMAIRMRLFLIEF